MRFGSKQCQTVRAVLFSVFYLIFMKWDIWNYKIEGFFFKTIFKMAKGLKLVQNERKLNHPDGNYAFHPFAVERISSRSSLAPRARSGHRIVCDDSTLFCFGGYNPSSVHDVIVDPSTWTEENPLFKELWSYSISKGRWTLLPVKESIPEELASNAVCLEGKTLMIYGGTGSPFGLRCSNMLSVYHTSGDQGGLKRVNTVGEAPSPQYGQAIVYHDGYLYTVGGTNGYNYTCDIHRLHLKTKTWEAIYTCTGNTSDEPPGRYRHEMAFDGLNIYILAGGTAETSFDFTNIPIFNIETNTWQFKKSLPDPRFDAVNGYPNPRMCHSAVQVNNPNNIHVFIIGGTGGQTIFKDIWRLEIPSLQWTLMMKTVLPKKIHFHSSTITPAGCVFTFGGVQLKGTTYIRTNTMYKTWIRIPKLSEMCWEAILHYNPEIGNVNKTKLLLSGIPLNFVERLE